MTTSAICLVDMGSGPYLHHSQQVRLLDDHLGIDDLPDGEGDISVVWLFIDGRCIGVVDVCKDMVNGHVRPGDE